MINSINANSRHHDVMLYLFEAAKSREDIIGRTQIDLLVWAAVIISSLKKADDPAEFLKSLGDNLDFKYLLMKAEDLQDLQGKVFSKV